MKVLLVYPNLYGMNMLPPAIGLFTAILRINGHVVGLFDTTAYEDLAPIDSDKQKADNLNARPYDDSLLRHAAKHSDPLGDFCRVVRQFSPGLIQCLRLRICTRLGLRFCRLWVVTAQGSPRWSISNFRSRSRTAIL